MKKLIAGVVLGVGLIAMAHGAGDPEAGEENAETCASCHGKGGAKPVMGVYPKLSGIGEKYLYQQLVLIKDKDREISEMSGLLDDMSDQDLQDLAAYFNEQKISVAQADPDLVDEGKAIYRGGNLASGVPSCAGCHSPRGAGNEPAGYPRLSGQSAEYVEKQLKAYRDGDRSGGPNSAIMMDVAAKLTDAEIEAVSSYVSGLN
ncbi:c-type cytochrome [Marinobacter sp. HL-58]|uniref:c-type cytochrome n=1 Tax=Marinobacter sp. HL-58 TaxID=1479237 RepID=UPI000489A068|nr:c-type cytochrome [Marinobacter sp. HL-58]KPQ02844.1 MAG: diheme cytochrome c [Marinobacter sp. HL-58]